MSLSELPPLTAEDADPSNRVVILGAGYGGLRCAQMLGKYIDDPVATEVVLMDRYSYHQIITELPVAASGRVGTEEIALPLDQLLQRSKVRFLQAEVQHIDLDGRQIETTRGNISYGTLVVALGSITAFYGVPGLADHAFTLKSVEDAEAIDARMKEIVGLAAKEADPQVRAALLSVLVGGAGLTGTELAGELAELLPELARAQGLPPTEPRVILVEAAPVVLPSMPERLQVRGASILSEIGVRLMLGSKVVDADPEGITLASGDRLVGRTLIWTGGIMAPPLLAQSGLPTVRNGQVLVDMYLRAEGQAGVYVIGDAAFIPDESGHGALAPTAQVALSQAETAAYNIVAGWEGWTERPYTAHDKGQVVSLGSAQGVASVFDIQLSGRKVIALKNLIAEGYRSAVTGRLPFRTRAATTQPRPSST
jgi:NADH dehydrogenase